MHGDPDWRDDDQEQDPHVWTSPVLARHMIGRIRDKLTELAPTHAEAFARNHDTYVAELEALDRELHALLDPLPNRNFMVFHPAWGHFADAYGLKQVPIEIEGKDPKPAQLKELIQHARENGIKVVFVQPQFSTKSAELIAREIGGQVAFANPLAEDWMANLRQVADKFEAALK